MRKPLCVVVGAFAVVLTALASAETAVYVPPACPELQSSASDEALLRCFAPVIVAAGVEESFNRVGSLLLEHGTFGGLAVRVDPDVPSLYAEVRPDIVGGEMVLQLVYRLHFERIPFRLEHFFYEAHRNPGLLLVVTIDPRDLRPLFVTSAQTCGCYTAVLPTENVRRAALPDDWPADRLHVYGQTLPAILERPEAGARPVVRLQADNHRVTDLGFASAPPAGRRVDLSLVPMALLRSMPVEGDVDGERASVFHQTWPARGHLRGAWNPFEGLTVFGLVALDPMVGMDKDFGDPAKTGTEFYTMLTPWRQSASRLDRFDRLLRELGFRTDAIW